MIGPDGERAREITGGVVDAAIAAQADTGVRVRGLGRAVERIARHLDEALHALIHAPGAAEVDGGVVADVRIGRREPAR